MKDRIPQYELKQDHELKDDVYRWWLNEENFKKDEDGNFIPLKVPSTDAEKEKYHYSERSTHRTSGEPLMRTVYNSDFDPNQQWIFRADRRKEWCVVGLLGQVPVRDTAVIPDHWVKMKNLESGIDMYFIK